MLVNEVYDTKAIAARREQLASNFVPYLGETLFPNKTKAGIDLKWFTTYDKLPVALAPSHFDTLPAIRSREGIEATKTKMAFFREEMTVDEETALDIDCLKDSADPRLEEVVLPLYNDANTLIEGARTAAEIMRMQLLATTNGNPCINISANGVQYSYNFDPNNKWKAKHYVKLSTSWITSATATPLTDMINAVKSMRKLGKNVKYAIMTSTTFDALGNCKQVKEAAILGGAVIANLTPVLTDTDIKAIIKAKVGIDVIVYDKFYEDAVNGETSFFPDYKVAFIAEGTLGNTWHGTTPEGRSARQMKDADISVIANATVTVVTQYGPPVITKTVVSDVMLPSYEGMSNVFVLEMDAPTA